MRPRLQPEYLRRDIAPFRSIEQLAGDLRIRLGHTAIELITKVLAQRLRVATNDRGDVLLPDAYTRQRSHLLARRVSREEGFSRHGQLLVDVGPCFGALVEGSDADLARASTDSIPDSGTKRYHTE